MFCTVIWTHKTATLLQNGNIFVLYLWKPTIFPVFLSYHNVGYTFFGRTVVRGGGGAIMELRGLKGGGIRIIHRQQFAARTIHR